MNRFSLIMSTTLKTYSLLWLASLVLRLWSIPKPKKMSFGRLSTILPRWDILTLFIIPWVSRTLLCTSKTMLTALWTLKEWPQSFWEQRMTVKSTLIYYKLWRNIKLRTRTCHIALQTTKLGVLMLDLRMLTRQTISNSHRKWLNTSYLSSELIKCGLKSLTYAKTMKR